MKKDKFVAIGALMGIATGIIISLIYFQHIPKEFIGLLGNSGNAPWSVKSGASNQLGLVPPLVFGFIGAFFGLVVFELVKYFRH